MRRKAVPIVHPGDFLAEILDESGVSQAQFARMIGVSPMRVSHVIKGTRPVTAELALLFGRAFGQVIQTDHRRRRHITPCNVDACQCGER